MDFMNCEGTSMLSKVYGIIYNMFILERVFYCHVSH